MPKPGNQATNRLVIRFVNNQVEGCYAPLRKRIRRIGASRIPRSNMTAVMIMGWGAPGWGEASAPDCRPPAAPKAAIIFSSVDRDTNRTPCTRGYLSKIDHL